MNPDLKYKRYVIKKFLQELRGYRIYYNDKLKSYWWINPNKKDWIFEMEKSGTLWWYYSWGERFKSLLSLDDEEFKNIIETYVKITLNLGVNKFINSLYINGETPLMDDYELDFEEHILECINSRTSSVTPVLEIKNLYKIDDPSDDEVEELIVSSKEDVEVLTYCHQLERLGLDRKNIFDILEKIN